MVDVKEEEKVKTTDMAPVSIMPTSSPVVKIQLPTKGSETQARIRSEDGKIDMWVPVDMVLKRFPRGKTKAYFKAQIKGRIGTLEIGERVFPEPKW